MTNISGFWVGHYTYDEEAAPSVDFDIEITHVGKTLSGIVTEPNSLKEMGYTASGALVSANLTGSMSGSTLTFLKTYQGKGVPLDSVIYNGHIDKGEKCISGTWNLSTYTGTFEMRRDGPAVGVKANLTTAVAELELDPTPTQ